MNIFILDRDIEKCAQYHCDRHVIKMITESCQIISTAIISCQRLVPTDQFFDILYKPTHKNHPCVKWAGEDERNIYYLKELTKSLVREYEHRFKKTDRYINAKNILSLCDLIYTREMGPPTHYALAMPDKYKESGEADVNNTVASYRRYYNGEKTHIHKWTNRETPHWIKSE